MANIIPTTGATGSAPLMLNEHKGNTESGTGTNIGTVRTSNDKNPGGLDVQADELATSYQIDDNKAGINGRRYTSGLSNTDLSGAVTGIHVTGNAINRIDINSVANNGMVMMYINGTGFTNYRVWTVRGNDSSIGDFVGYDIYVIDPSVAGTQADTGTYDNTSLDQWGIACDTQGGYSSQYCWFFFNKQWRVLKTKAGACGIYGTNPTFEDYHDNAVTEAWTLFNVSTDLFRIVCPFKIGDGTTTTTFTSSGKTLFTPVGQANGGADQFHVGATSYPFYLDLTTSDTISLTDYNFNWGEASDFDFDVSTAATVTLTNCTFTGIGDITLGSSITGICTFNNATGKKVIIEGADLDGSTMNCDVDLNTATDLTDITIDGDLRINIAADTTLNFSNVTVTGDVYNDATGNTLTINSSNGSSLTAGDAGTGNGQTNILNTVTVKVTAKDSGDTSNIQNARIYLVADAGGDLAEDTVILNALSNASGVVQDTAFNYTTDQPVKGWVRKGTSSPYYKNSAISGTILSSGFESTLFLVSDE